MATFEIESSEGTRWAKIAMQDETIVTERGAMSHMRGDIAMKARLPGPIRLVRAALSGEDAFRPTFSGTGSLYLESTLGGFHIMQLEEEETWIVSAGAFWASEAKVEQGFIRERFWTSLRTGEGFLSFQTKVTGPGQVMICSPGPVECIELGKDSPHGTRLVADGRQVLARTKSINYKARMPGWLPWSRLTTGERVLRVYEGTGRLLICTTPYWRYKMAQVRAAEANGGGTGAMDDM
jgi:uncharacterized protein (AIM24 family)